ncbi:MAG: FAD-dependent oxidoreductase [Desulfobacteraceae bacterium]|jgi:thioredoxin reductase (NADPH)
MSGIKNTEKKQDLNLDQVQDQVKTLFKNIPNDISLLLFTSPGKNDVFSDTNRQVIRAFRELTSRIDLLEFEISHKEAQKRNISYSPTLLIEPDRYNIRWYGAPLGEEAKTFAEAIMMIGYGETGIGSEAKKVLDRIDGRRDVKVFVSSTCPYCPQQAVNALKAAIARPEIISVEIIDIQANQELAEKYGAQSVPQVYANEKLIAMGAQPEELFMLSLEKLEQQNVYIPESDAEEIEADLVIIGGGPAGLTAGIYGARAGLNTVIIERDTLGGQVASTPTVENFPGLTQIGGKALVDLMVTHALEYVKIFPGEEVMEIAPGEPNIVTTNRRRFKTKTVLLATGAAHRKLNAPGENSLSGHGVSYCSTCDGPLFKGEKVIMAGGGDSAVTEALHLKNIGVDVTIIHRRDKLRAQDHLIKNLESNNIPVMYNTEIKEIRGAGRVEEVELLNNSTNKTSTMEVDGVFISIGYSPSVELAKAIGAELTDEGYIKHDSRHRTSIKGIYSAGDVEGGYKQIVTAAGHGSEAALAIFEDLVNPYWKKED